MAYAYLQNALALLKDSAGGERLGADCFTRSAVYMNLAYVTLSMNQPERCLFFVEKLKHLPDINSQHAFYARMYEVEALCLMDRSQEAAEVMRSLIVSFDNSAFSQQEPNSLGKFTELLN